jgi:hypothetical protein
MSHLPELRASLVRAAHRQAETPEPPRVPVRAGRPGRSFGAAVLMGASLAALIVAGVVLVLAGHRAPAPPLAVSPAAPYGTRAAARTVAAELLAAFKAPAGAAVVSGDLSQPRRLGYPNSGLPVASAFDLHRFYRVPGDPQTVMNTINPQRSFSAALSGAVDGGYYGTGVSSSGSESSSGPGATPVVNAASMTFPLAAVGGIARELQVGVASAGHGMSALRVDAQAWWLVPRPASERIPTNVTSITVQELGPLPPLARRYRPLTRLVTLPQIRAAVALLNSLSARQPTAGPCGGKPAFRIRLVFLGTGQRPEPTALIRPGCDVGLSLAGRTQPPLSWSSSSQFVGVFQLMELLIGAPRTNPFAVPRGGATSSPSTAIGGRSALAGWPQTTTPTPAP